MQEAQIAAEATITAAQIGAIATIMVAIIAFLGVVYQAKRNRSKSNKAPNKFYQKAEGTHSTVIGIQNNYGPKEKKRDKR